MFTVKARKWRASTSMTRTLPKGPATVKVGFPAGKADSAVIKRAVWSEFGTRGGASGGGWGGPIPERPFMRNAMRDNREKYAFSLTAAARKILLATATGGDADTLMRQTLSKLGALAQGDIQAEITALSSPPNSPVTIALKGSSNPLIDTGEMHSSVSWKVDE